MRRKKRDVSINLGIAWYRPEQWEHLLEISSDRGKLEESFEEWLEFASKRYAEMKRKGLLIQKVDVDVEELLSWCKSRGRSVDASARAEFTAEKLRQKYESIK